MFLVSGQVNIAVSLVLGRTGKIVCTYNCSLDLLLTNIFLCFYKELSNLPVNIHRRIVDYRLTHNYSN